MTASVISRSAIVSIVVLLSLISVSSALKKPTQLPPAQLSDIKYIQCEVCKLLAKNAHGTAVKMRRNKAKGKKVAEMELIEAMEKLTDPIREEGNWISRIDLQEKGDKLTLVDMGKVGECGRECKTIAKAADQILGEHDTDLAEMLLKGKKNRNELTTWLCYELSGACKKTPPPLPLDRPRGPAFVPLPEEEVKVTNMMGEMRAKGMRGKMVKPDEVLEKGGMMGMEDDDDDDMLSMLNGELARMRATGDTEPDMSGFQGNDDKEEL